MNLDINNLFQPITDRWESLPTRDRRALTVLLTSGTLLLLWFGIINPISTWRSNSAAELAAARETYQTLVDKAPLAMTSAGGGATAGGTGSLNTELRRQANRFGLDIQSFEPDGDLLRVRMENVRYSNVVRWLAALEEQGIVTEQLTMDARDTAGLVSLRAGFQR